MTLTKLTSQCFCFSYRCPFFEKVSWVFSTCEVKMYNYIWFIDAFCGLMLHLFSTWSLVSPRKLQGRRFWASLSTWWVVAPWRIELVTLRKRWKIAMDQRKHQNKVGKSMKSSKFCKCWGQDSKLWSNVPHKNTRHARNTDLLSGMVGFRKDLIPINWKSRWRKLNLND